MTVPKVRVPRYRYKLTASGMINQANFFGICQRIGSPHVGGGYRVRAGCFQS